MPRLLSLTTYLPTTPPYAQSRCIRRPRGRRSGTGKNNGVHTDVHVWTRVLSYGPRWAEGGTCHDGVGQVNFLPFLTVLRTARAVSTPSVPGKYPRTPGYLDAKSGTGTPPRRRCCELSNIPHVGHWPIKFNYHNPRHLPAIALFVQHA